MRVLAALATIGSLAAPGTLAALELPGLPPPEPPAWWLALGNDAWGPKLIDNRDDGRSATLDLGAAVDRWSLAVDGSLLTAKREERRSDEVTGTVGYDLLDGAPELRLLAGFRVAGDIGGADVQRRWHRAVGYVFDDIPYQPATPRWTPLAGISSAWAWRPSPVGVRAVAQGTATGRGELQGLIALHALVEVPGVQGWAGPVWQVRAGDAEGTAQTVAEQERGPGLAAGLAVGLLTLELSRNLRTDDIQGSLGVRAVPMSGGDQMHAVLELGAPLSAPGLIERLRVGGARWPVDLLVDARDGVVPGTSYDHDSVRYRQVSAGIGWAPRWGGTVAIGPDAGAVVGWRVEGIAQEDSATELPRTSAHGLALAGNAGLGADLRLDGATIGLAGGIDGWLPLRAARPVGFARLLEPGHGWNLRLASGVSW